MKLYLLKNLAMSGWDYYQRCVVCAENEEQARRINPDVTCCGCSWPINDVERVISVTYIGVAADAVVPGVVCSDYVGH